MVNHCVHTRVYSGPIQNVVTLHGSIKSSKRKNGEQRKHKFIIGIKCKHSRGKFLRIVVRGIVKKSLTHCIVRPWCSLQKRVVPNLGRVQCQNVASGFITNGSISDLHTNENTYIYDRFSMRKFLMYCFRIIIAEISIFSR